MSSHRIRNTVTRGALFIGAAATTAALMYLLRSRPDDGPGDALLPVSPPPGADDHGVVLDFADTSLQACFDDPTWVAREFAAIAAASQAPAETVAEAPTVSGLENKGSRPACHTPPGEESGPCPLPSGKCPCPPKPFVQQLLTDAAGSITAAQTLLSYAGDPNDGEG